MDGSMRQNLRGFPSIGDGAPTCPIVDLGFLRSGQQALHRAAYAYFSLRRGQRSAPWGFGFGFSIFGAPVSIIAVFGPQEHIELTDS